MLRITEVFPTGIRKTQVLKTMNLRIHYMNFFIELLNIPFSLHQKLMSKFTKEFKEFAKRCLF